MRRRTYGQHRPIRNAPAHIFECPRSKSAVDTLRGRRVQSCGAGGAALGVQLAQTTRASSDLVFDVLAAWYINSGVRSRAYGTTDGSQ